MKPTKDAQRTKQAEEAKVKEWIGLARTQGSKDQKKE